MKNVYVRKTLKYDPTFDGKYSKFEGYRLIGLNKLDPEIICKQKLKTPNDFNIVFCSNLKRARETADAISSNVIIRSYQELNEASFDLNSLVSPKEYEKYGSNIVRKRFIEAFEKNILMEKRESIKERIESFLNVLYKIPDGKYLIVSHSFFMKILQTYIADRNLFTKPEILRSYLNPMKMTYNFGEGFELEI